MNRDRMEGSVLHGCRGMMREDYSFQDDFLKKPTLNGISKKVFYFRLLQAQFPVLSEESIFPVRV